MYEIGRRDRFNQTHNRKTITYGRLNTIRPRYNKNSKGGATMKKKLRFQALYAFKYNNLWHFGIAEYRNEKGPLQLCKVYKNLDYMKTHIDPKDCTKIVLIEK